MSRTIKNRKSAYQDHPPYKILPKQEEMAKEIGVSIEPSKDKMKKLDVFIDFNYRAGQNKNRFPQQDEKIKVASIGGYYQDGEPYGDYFTYKKTGKDRYGNDVSAEKKRVLYNDRHKHEKKPMLFTPSKAIVDKIERETGAKFKPLKIGTPSFYADAILWNWIKPEWFKLKYDPKKIFVGDKLD